MRHAHQVSALWRDMKLAEDRAPFQAWHFGTNFNDSDRHHFGKEDKGHLSSIKWLRIYGPSREYVDLGQGCPSVGDYRGRFPRAHSQLSESRQVMGAMNALMPKLPPEVRKRFSMIKLRYWQLYDM